MISVLKVIDKKVLVPREWGFAAFLVIIKMSLSDKSDF